MRTRYVVGALLAVALLAGCGASEGVAPPPETPSVEATTPSQEVTAPPITEPAAPLAVETSSWDRGRFELSDGAVTEDWGLLAAPAEGGPFPVAVLLHGAHTACPTDTGEGRTWPCPEGTEIPHHEGLAYLAEALAARGFVVAAPGLNVQHTFGSGEPAPATRTAEIVGRTLAELRAGALGVDADRIDADRLVLVGHSVGGQEATMLASGAAGFDVQVDGVVMLQPALNSEDALPLADVPAAVLLSECDGDTGVRGGQYLTTAMLDARTAPAALLVLEHATHNATNTGLSSDSFPVESPGCAPDRVMPAADQQALLAGVVPELAHAVLRDGAGGGWAGVVFDSPEPPEGMHLDVVRADQPVPAIPGPGPGIPDGVEAEGMATTFCPIGYYTPFMEPGTEACHRPELPLMVGLPQTIAATWTESGASLRYPVGAEPGAELVLRAFADPADHGLTGGSVELRVTTPEGADAAWTLPVPEFTRDDTTVFELTHALVMWSTLRLPVPDDASEVTITVESPSSGSIQLVSIGAER